VFLLITENKKEAREMIIDIHTHNFAGKAEAVASSAAHFGIDRFILLGDVLRYGTLPSPDEVRKINDDTLSYVRRYANRARGFCFLNPDNPAEFQKSEIRRCLEMPEFCGVKLEISVNTIKVHVCSILQKMGVEDRTQAAIKAIRENLIN
jgi:predicted TIM-barrel fold metal-dependent hydrolase